MQRKNFRHSLNTSLRAISGPDNICLVPFPSWSIHKKSFLLYCFCCECVCLNEVFSPCAISMPMSWSEDSLLKCYTGLLTQESRENTWNLILPKNSQYYNAFSGLQWLCEPVIVWLNILSVTLQVPSCFYDCSKKYIRIGKIWQNVCSLFSATKIQKVRQKII